MASNRDLPENRFINESYNKNPSPMWIWGFVVVAIIAVAWGTTSWWKQEGNVQLSNAPFYKVTNRQFSLFAWQFPQFIGEAEVVPLDADQSVKTKDVNLFLYHTWDRLLQNDYYPRPIPAELFQEFLEQTKIWMPQNWAQAPQAYQSFVKSIAPGQSLESATKTELPKEVRMAFQGWRNYYKERSQIEAIKPTYNDLVMFLKVSPNYARNYWRNILMQTEPKYLISVNNEKSDADAAVPANELDIFLKIAYYNYSMARKGS